MSKAALLGPLVIFLALALVELGRPGLHYDEALEAGQPAVRLLNGQPVPILNGVGLSIGGLRLPLMVQNHIGAAQIYASMPFILAAGPSTESLRAMGVAAGLLTIVSTYLFMAQVYGRTAALYAALWLATFASFVFWMRQGVFITALAPAFAMTALAAGARWWRTGRARWLGLAGLFAGQAIYSKLSALWIFTALACWLLLAVVAAKIGGRQQGPRLPLSRPAVGLGLLGLLLGCWPLIAYNVISGGTLAVVGRNTGRTYLGADNTDVLGNLRVRLDQAADVIRSGGHLWYLGGTYIDQLALVTVLLAVAVLIAGCVLRRGAGWRRSLLLPFLALAALAQSCYTISALWPTHFAVVAPLPAMIVGLGLSEARSWRPGRRSGRVAGWIATLLVAAALVSQLRTSLRYLDAAVSSGGFSFHSSAIYDLSRYLEGRREHIVALDWGVAAQVEYLSGGRTAIEEFFSYQHHADETPAELVAKINERDLYITHAQYQEAFQHRAAFLRAASAANLRAERVHVSQGAEGPLIEVWKMRKLP